MLGLFILPIKYACEELRKLSCRVVYSGIVTCMTKGLTKGYKQNTLFSAFIVLAN